MSQATHLRSLLVVLLATICGPVLLAQQPPDASKPPEPPASDESVLIGTPKGITGSLLSDASVASALAWLARHQEVDGSWSAKDYLKRCVPDRACGTVDWDGASPEEHRAGLTGLALLAFLEAGVTPTSTEVFARPKGSGSNGTPVRSGDCVQRAADWLRKSQDGDGCIGGQSSSKYMYGAAIGTYALAEFAFATKDPAASGAVQRAVDFLVSAQNPYKGWRYTKRCGDNDSSVTGWCVLALKAGERAGCKVPPSAFAGAKAWFDEVTDDTYFKVGYTARGTGKVVTTENMDYLDHPALEALATRCRLLMSVERDSDPAKGAMKLVVNDLPCWEPAKKSMDFYYWYWGTQAVALYDAPAGPFWSAWAHSASSALLSHQTPAGKPDALTTCDAGSWPPVGRWCFEGGRVSSTALNCLTVEALLRNGVPEVAEATAMAGPGPEAASPPAADPDLALRKQLGTLKLTLDFESAPLSDVLSFLREVSGCNIVLDPAVRETSDELVTLKVRDLPLDKALKLLLSPLELDYLVEDGIIYILTEKGMDAHRTRRLNEKLSSLVVTLDFQATPLSEVLSFLSEFSEISFIFDASVMDAARERQVTLQIRNASMRDTLTALMRTVGCRFEVQPAAVVIVQSTPVAPDSSQPVRRAYSLAKLGIGLDSPAVIGLLTRVEPTLAGKVEWDEPTGCLIVEAPEPVQVTVMSTLREIAGTRRESAPSGK